MSDFRPTEIHFALYVISEYQFLESSPPTSRIYVKTATLRERIRWVGYGLLCASRNYDGVIISIFAICAILKTNF